MKIFLGQLRRLLTMREQAARKIDNRDMNLLQPADEKVPLRICSTVETWTEITVQARWKIHHSQP